MAQSPRRRRGVSARGCGIFFPGSFCDRSRDAVYRALARYRPRLRVHAIARHNSGDVRLDRPWNESPLSRVKRAVRLAQAATDTGPMDLAGKTGDGLSAD